MSVYSSELGGLTCTLVRMGEHQLCQSHAFHNISHQSDLGEGQFGKVMKGTWLGPEHIEVAVKVLKDESEKVKLLKEAAIMGQFAHPNIVQLYGLTTVTKPVSVNGVVKGWLTCERASVSLGVHVCAVTL